MPVKRAFLTLVAAVLASAMAAPFADARAADNQPQSTSRLAQIYGRLPLVLDAAISPDGSKLVLAETQGSTAIAGVVEIDTLKTLVALKQNVGQTLRSVDWADDGLAVGLVSVTVPTAQLENSGWRIKGNRRIYEFFRAAAIDVETKRSVLLLDEIDSAWAQSNPARVIAPIEGDPGFGRMIARVEPQSTAALGLYRVNLRTGRGRILKRFPGKTAQIVFDERGAPIARSALVDLAENTWETRAIDGDDERVIGAGRNEFGRPPPFVGKLPDGRLGQILTDGPRGTARLVALDLKTGENAPIWAVDGFDVDDAIRDPWTGRIVGAHWTDSLAPRQVFFDPELKAAAGELQKSLPDGFAMIRSWSRDRSRLIVTAEGSAAAGGAFLLFEPRTRAMSLIRSRYPDVKDWSDVQSITYPSRDGVRIPAVLTQPPRDAGARPPPLVVLIHGGPAARDSAQFDFWAQFLAANGYVVFQPNFRGSDGFGEDWKRAGYGQWGGRMSQDVEDGVRALIRSARIDPQRICFIGASYGAYAALTAAMQSPDIVRCAAGIGGVYDLPRLVGDELSGAIPDSPFADEVKISIGSLRTDRTALAEASPALNAGRIKAPVLLMHGTEDSVVAIGQTRAMHQALSRTGNISRYVELEGDDHWLSDAATRTRMLAELETFLAQHLGAP